MSYVVLDDNFSRTQLQFDVPRIKRQVCKILVQFRLFIPCRYWNGFCAVNLCWTQRISGIKYKFLFQLFLTSNYRQPFAFKIAEEVPKEPKKNVSAAEEGAELLLQHLGVRPLRYRIR
jgi:hypothetical protein